VRGRSAARRCREAARGALGRRGRLRCAAWRRWVARNMPPADVLRRRVAREVGQLLDVDATNIGRYEGDGTVISVAGWKSRRRPHAGRQPGNHRGHQRHGACLSETGRPLAGGPLRRRCPTRPASRFVPSEPRSSVEGHLWGVMIASSNAEDPPLPPTTEARIAAFHGNSRRTAISNTEGEGRGASARRRGRRPLRRGRKRSSAQDLPSSQPLLAAVTREGRRAPGRPTSPR